MQQTDLIKFTQQSLWLRMWQPFLNLSVYGKFVLVLTSFLAGFILLGLHNLYFINNLKVKLTELQTGPSGATIRDTIHAADQFLQNGAFLVIGIMVVLTITSFLCVRMMVSLLYDMTNNLQAVRKSTGEPAPCQLLESVPIISDDEIGMVAREVNGIINDIQNIQRFRRIIEGDESTNEVYRRLAYVFKERLGLNLFVTAGITKRDLTWVVRAAFPWLTILLGFLVLITYVPQISLWLPEFIDKLKGY